MLLETKYGLWFHMPSAAEVENEGFVQLADPAVIGPVDSELAGDAELRGDAELPDGAGPSEAAG
jgi:hypothetical protein